MNCSIGPCEIQIRGVIVAVTSAFALFMSKFAAQQKQHFWSRDPLISWPKKKYVVCACNVCVRVFACAWVVREPQPK